MKIRIISIALLLCLLINTLALASCSSNDSTDEDDTTIDLENLDDIDLEKPPMLEHAIIQMIRPIDGLNDWQAGKTEHAAIFYVDDMMEIFDKLEWESAEEEGIVSGDFDFRINLYRTQSELADYEKFVKDPELQLFPITEEDKDGVSVQYLINYADKIVNMRLYDYSAHVFDIYAELDEHQMHVLLLCLKYYFGAHN